MKKDDTLTFQELMELCQALESLTNNNQARTLAQTMRETAGIRGIFPRRSHIMQAVSEFAAMKKIICQQLGETTIVTPEGIRDSVFCGICGMHAAYHTTIEAKPPVFVYKCDDGHRTEVKG